jgi:hypothetical protein
MPLGGCAGDGLVLGMVGPKEVAIADMAGVAADTADGAADVGVDGAAGGGELAWTVASAGFRCRTMGVATLRIRIAPTAIAQ